MGVKNLIKLIKEFAPAAISNISVTNLREWKIAIDTSILIYQWCSVGHSRRIVNSHGKFINHIQGAFFSASSMILRGILPVYIFDGVPPLIKAPTLAARKSKSVVKIPPGVFTEVSILLSLMGLRAVQAPSEAEAQAAYLNKNSIVDAVLTSDTDAFTFGGKVIIRELDSAKKVIQVIETNKILQALNITMNQFIDLCILLGCDYTKTLSGIGYKRALTLIKRYGTIEELLAGEDIHDDDFKYKEAREEFKMPRVTTIDPLNTPGKIDITKLRNYLIEVHGLDANRVNKRLKQLEEYYKIV